MRITKQKVWGPIEMPHNNFIFLFISLLREFLV